MMKCDTCFNRGRPPYKYPCSECIEGEHYEEAPKIPTNADHIRSMSDEELCDFILEKRENGHCFNNRCYVNDPCKGCDDCTMEWLKQPYKEKE